MKTAVSVSLGLGLIPLTGCLTLYAAAVVAGDAEVQRRLSESKCGDAACAREHWRVSSIYWNYIDYAFDGITDRLPEDPVTSASRNRSDRRLAVSLASGS